MSTHFKEIGKSNREALADDLRVRWAYLEETLRLELAQRVEGLMKTLGLTQKELAKRSQTTQDSAAREGQRIAGLDAE